MSTGEWTLASEASMSRRLMATVSHWFRCLSRFTSSLVAKNSAPYTSFYQTNLDHQTDFQASTLKSHHWLEPETSGHSFISPKHQEWSEQPYQSRMSQSPRGKRGL